MAPIDGPTDLYDDLDLDWDWIASPSKFDSKSFWFGACVTSFFFVMLMLLFVPA